MEKPEMEMKEHAAEDHGRKEINEDGLDREIQQAIAQHDMELQRQQQQQEQPQQTEEPKENLHTEPTEFQRTSENGLTENQEKQSLQFIADELHKATGADMTQENGENAEARENEEAEDSSEKRPGQHIPDGSELLSQNSVLAAYNAISSQLPQPALPVGVQLAALPLPIVTPDYLPARIQLLVNTLPVLDNLATQLLRIFVACPYQRIIDMASSTETPQGAAFRDLASLFEFTKRLYSEEDPFLTVEHLAPGMWKQGDKTPSVFRSREQTIELTLRKVNLATFLAATLGTIEVGFFYLNESFLDVFCPANNLDPANSMCNMSVTNMNLQLGVNTTVGDKVGKLLKQQAVLFLDLKTQAYISAIEAAERSSEEILEDILPENMEEILLEKRGVKVLLPSETDFLSRCKARKETLLLYPQQGNLSEEYEWFGFLKELFDYVSKNMGFLIWGKRGRLLLFQKPVVLRTPHSDELLRKEEKAEQPEEKEVKAEEQQRIGDITLALLPSEIQEQQMHLQMNPRQQSKLAHRRPWTRDEEKALRHALELKGPLWSTILELFGQGGRINESLKNRTQVQLKDKARNWKMFFLKSGLPVPAYLQNVTGDLERDDKVRARNARNKKTAAAPVPAVGKRSADKDDSEAKRQKS